MFRYEIYKHDLFCKHTKKEDVKRCLPLCGAPIELPSIGIIFTVTAVIDCIPLPLLSLCAPFDVAEDDEVDDDDDEDLEDFSRDSLSWFLLELLILFEFLLLYLLLLLPLFELPLSLSFAVPPLDDADDVVVDDDDEPPAPNRPLLADAEMPDVEDEDVRDVEDDDDDDDVPLLPNPDDDDDDDDDTIFVEPPAFPEPPELLLLLLPPDFRCFADDDVDDDDKVALDELRPAPPLIPGFPKPLPPMDAPPIVDAAAALLGNGPPPLPLECSDPDDTAEPGAPDADPECVEDEDAAVAAAAFEPLCWPAAFNCVPAVPDNPAPEDPPPPPVDWPAAVVELLFGAAADSAFSDADVDAVL